MKIKLLACALASVGLCMHSVYAADQVINADVVVVGAGAGGTVAAVGAVEGGKKTVLLEKMLLWAVTATLWKAPTPSAVPCRKKPV